LEDLDGVLREVGETAAVLVVDDGSQLPSDRIEPSTTFRALTEIRVIELRRNLGHQRAIAVGLAYVEATTTHDAVVVMDGDGEDAPRDVPRLLSRYAELGGTRIIFAERTKRSESLVFRAFYGLFRTAFRILTGKAVRFGNFSVVPRSALHRLVAVSELWNHYAAAVVKSRLPYDSVPTSRGVRLRGRSRMNFVDLVIHGLSAISVESEVVGVRLLVVSVALIAASTIALGITLAIRLATSLAIPGWATTMVGSLLILMSQAVMLTLVFSFVTLGGRQGYPFLPCRDYHHYVGRVYPLVPPGSEHP
jgi:glycosyltransferase involved in cell wall biosynthesis